MKRETKILLPQFFELGKNKIDNVFSTLRSHDLKFKKILLLGDVKTFSIGGTQIASKFEKSEIKVVKHIVFNSDEDNVEAVKNQIKKTGSDLVIGFGGGKVLDVGKLAAGVDEKRFISVPTILSNDGIASPVSVIKDRNNIPVSHITRPPYGVIVDINIIKQAPIRHLKAGVGDLISNLSSVFDARWAQSKGYENINPEALTLAESGPIKLLEFNEKSIRSSDFLLCLTLGLIKSGIAMCLVGSSRPASGSEHKISHSIDHLFSPRKTLHGEQVGIAAIFTMFLQENPYLKHVKKLYEKISFPQKLQYFSISLDEFIQAIMNAPNIRPERYTILEEKTLTKAQIMEFVKEAGIA